MELLYFSDISQLDYVRASKPDMLKHMGLITGDMVVAFELERLGIDFIDEWDFITPDEIRANWETAHTLSRTWWDEHLASTEYEGFSLADAAQQDLIYPFEASLNARTVYGRIFSTHPIEKIRGYFLPSVGVVRTGPAPTSRAVRSVTQAILLYLAERHGITVERLNSSLPLSLGSSSYRGRAINHRKDAKFSTADNVADKIILVYETGMPASEHADLMEALDKLPGMKAVSISQRVLELATQSDAEIGFESFWNKFVESVTNYQGEYTEIFANEHLLFQFERIKKEMESASTFGDVFAAFLELLKPSLVIFGHEAFTIERVLVRLARNRKIPTAGLVHGGLGFKFAFRGLIGEADVIMLWNEIDIEWLTSFGVDKSRLNKIGSIRYESNYVKYASEHGMASPKTKRAAKIRLGVSQDKPLIVLITAEINTGLAAPIAEPGKHREAIRGFLALVDSRPDLQFIIKAHPGYDYFELYRRLLDPKRPNLAFLEQATLSEILEASDICLMINYCTTAALEAMLLRVPLVYMNNAVYPSDDWRDSLAETGLHRVATIDELERGIDSLLTNSVTKRSALNEADKQLRVVLGLNETPVCDRMLSLLKHVLDKPQPGNTGGLFATHRMCDFLYSGGVSSSKHFTELTMMHSGENLMFVFAYLAGFNNLGQSSIAKIFELFHNEAKNGKLSMWKTARWLLIQAYVTGRFSNPNHSGTFFINLKALIPYLHNPHKFIASSVSLKKSVAKYFIQHFLGKGFSPVIRTAYKLRNRYLGFGK